MKTKKPRRPRPHVRALGKAIAGFKDGSLTEADRQLIDLVLCGIAKDEDVRNYFFETVNHRPKGDSALKELAVMIVAISGIQSIPPFDGEEWLEKLSGEFPNGPAGKKRIAAKLTGLTKSQMEKAWRTYGEQYQELFKPAKFDKAERLGWQNHIEAILRQKSPYFRR